MVKSGSGGRSRRVSNGLVALSSAAVLGVYSAGYLRTRPAAARFALSAERRSPAPVAATEPVSAAPQPAPIPAAEPPARAVPTLSPVSTRAANQPSHRRPPTPRSQAAADQPVAVSSPVPVAAPVSAPAEAPAAIAAPVDAGPVADVAPPAPPKAQLKDGTYLGWGSSRHGDIQASVVIEGGRIASATIAQCLTRYSCSWIAALPPQVVARQSPNVDYVSGATQSTNAFYDAVVDALTKAK